MIKLLRVKERKYPGIFRSNASVRGLLLGMILLGSTAVTMAQVDSGEKVQNSREKGKTWSAGDYFSGEQLRRFHPTDLLKALQVMEPSLRVAGDAELYGSDPNYVPKTIDIRGKKSILGSDMEENVLPLIMVDGYEISIDRLADFDIHRVKSVSVIKDAAAMAVYGIRGGNGVIVITTNETRPGTLRVRYHFDGGVDMADLSSYDLMNAKQKLALEKEMGLYDGNEELYRTRLKNGNTNWLKVPLQKPFRHKHRLEVEGGDNSMLYQVYLLATPGNKGIMKGYKRDMYAVGTRLNYSHRGISVSDELRVDVIYSKDSPYGIFMNYMAINPYYRKYSEDGVAEAELGSGTFNPQPSPFYETTLSGFSKNRTTRVINNLQAAWQITEELTLSGHFVFSKDFNKQDQFVSPKSYRFMGLPIEDSELAGEYAVRRNNTTVYEEKLMLNYRNEFGHHRLNALLGIHSYASKVYSDNYTGVGLASDHMNYISFAQKYAFDRKPGGREFRDRLFGSYAVISYDYADRYMADAVLRVEKSSRLAPKKQVATSWGINGRWNIHREEMFAGCELLNRLTLQAGVGVVPGYQFDYNQVNPVYAYDIDNPYLNGIKNSLGLVTLSQINNYNPRLKWRSDRNFYVGLQLSMWERIDIQARYYNTLSKDLVVLKKSDVVTGFDEKWVNDGEIRNSGLEFSLNAGIWKDEEGLSLNLLVNGIMNKNELVTVPDYYRVKYNQAYAETGRQLTEGKAVNAIYAVKSDGVDPATGKEIYVGTNGKTGVWNVDDITCQGDPTPKFAGSFGLSGNYGNWDFNCMFRYSLGGKVYNQEAAEFVDMADLYANGPVQMRDKWQKAGQNAKWQGFENTLTLPTSRFVETRNVLSLSSLHVGYRFDTALAEKMYMKSLRLGVSCNDLFYSSSAKMERGLIYPFARGFTFSLQATF